MASKHGFVNLQTRVLEFFEKKSADPNDPFYRCLISTECTKPLKGGKLYNLVQHAKTHKTFFRKKFGIQEGELLNMPQQRLEFIQHCTELVTVNGEPFAILNKSGFLKMNANKVQALTDAGYGSGLAAPACTAVRQHIDLLSSEIMSQIKNEARNKFVSLMVDGATKFRRSILGLSLQFMCDSKIIIRSIGMINLTASHTAEHLAKVILERLSLFEIKPSQLIAITADNAPNMSAMIELINNEASDDINSSDAYSDSDSDIYDPIQSNTEKIQPEEESQFTVTDPNYLESILCDTVDEMEMQDVQCDEQMLELLENRPNLEALLQDLQNILTTHTMNINSIRCAAHSLQLAVMSALAGDAFAIIIRLCRAVCKELRKSGIIFDLNQNNIYFTIPGLDCKTRWNSIYTMVRLPKLLSIFATYLFFYLAFGLSQPLHRSYNLSRPAKKGNAML